MFRIRVEDTVDIAVCLSNLRSNHLISSISVYRYRNIKWCLVTLGVAQLRISYIPQIDCYYFRHQVLVVVKLTQWKENICVNKNASILTRISLALIPYHPIDNRSFRHCLGALHATFHYLIQCEQTQCHHMASLRQWVIANWTYMYKYFLNISNTL